MSQQARTHRAKQMVDELLRLYAPARRHRYFYWELVRLVQARTGILAVSRNPTRQRVLVMRRLIQGLSKISKRRTSWIRPLEKWQDTPNSRRQAIRSLMRHLFERYPVPDFVPLSWIREDDHKWHEELYLHMAEGRGIRQFSGRPKIPLSPKAVKHFLTAPPHLSPTEALRFAQIRGLGGKKSLALSLIRFTHLNGETKDERFWETALQFTIRNQPLLLHQEELELVRFLEEQRFSPGEEVWGPSAGLAPLQPEFSLKGRTLRSLRRHMANWREDILRKRPELANKTLGWSRSKIAPWVEQQEDGKWLIFELVNDRALLLEGIAMNHCVDSYVNACVGGRSSIWSLRLHRGGTPKRMVTIEVDPSNRRIIDAKGKSNSSLPLPAKEVIHRWAEFEGLEIADYL